MRHSVATVVMILGLCMTGCESQDATDQRNLRKHFNLSRDTELLEYTGYPAMVGFGQREGLQIQAVYQLSATQVAEIVKNGEQTGWRKLPIPAETLAKLPFNNAKGTTQINMPFTTSQGFFLCKTVGDNVLSSPVDAAHLCESQPGTLHCTELMTLEKAKTSDKCKLRFGDQILGILDLQQSKLHVFIGSTY